eukprot:m.312564 g.312564  ORF g.312564 m.312564 type:complete len:208 (-) comp30725_c0_seq1:520-1143(-)
MGGIRAAVAVLVVLALQALAVSGFANTHPEPDPAAAAANVAAMLASSSFSDVLVPTLPCEALHAAFAAARPTGKPPPEALTVEQERSFTLDGAIPLAHMYVDDSGRGAGTHYQYPARLFQTFVDRGKTLLDEMTAAMPGRRPLRAHDEVVLQALAALQTQLVGARVVVFGSTEPFWEGILLAAGTAHITVVEYNKLTYGILHEKEEG